MCTSTVPHLAVRRIQKRSLGENAAREPHSISLRTMVTRGDQEDVHTVFKAEERLSTYEHEKRSASSKEGAEEVEEGEPEEGEEDTANPATDKLHDDASVALQVTEVRVKRFEKATKRAKI